MLQYHVATLQTSPLFEYFVIMLVASPQKLEVSIGYLVGDCLVAAAFLSYAGPFLSNYRDELVQQTWLKQVSMQWLYTCGIIVVVTVAVSVFLTEILLTGGNLS